MYKQNSEFKSIQKKLVGAVAMVLVACIMVVSSSYAWFTLSTAPEVTGIQTSVGSNGNLEMALRLLADLTQIQNAVGGETTVDANKTWGNLVDLSDGSYHLSEVSLAPARLNIVLDESNSKYSEVTDVDIAGAEGAFKVGDSYNGGVITEATYNEQDANWDITYKTLVKAAYKLNGEGNNVPYLRTPVYGVDGRLDTLSIDNVINGVYDDDVNGFAESLGKYGVRVIGTTSDLTPAQMALRTAKQAVSTAISTSKSNATVSLRDDSVKLANILVNKYLVANYTYKSSDIQDVKNAISSLQDIVDSFEDALKQTVIAVSVAKGVTGLTAEEIVIGNGTVTISNSTKNFEWTGAEGIQQTVIEASKTLFAMDGVLTNATTEINSDDVEGALGYLLSVSDFEIIDSASGVKYTVEALKDLADKQPGAAAKVLMGTPTVSIKGGIYKQIAQFSGNYSAGATMMVNVTYGSISLNNEPIDVIMATNAPEQTISYTQGEAKTATGYYLPIILNLLSDVTVSDAGGAAKPVITDKYGYAIDLAFRTNAAGSSLLLQTEAANRVEESDLTQGGGSFMQFKSGNSDFTLDQVANLMESIRVVFIDDNGQIYGVAALDVDGDLVAVKNGNKRVEYDESKHYFYETVLCAKNAGGNPILDDDGNPVPYVSGADGHASSYEVKFAMQLKAGEVVEGENDELFVRAALNLYVYSVDNSGKMTLDRNNKQASNALTELQQNAPLGVTTLVYLDGDTVENRDVAINGSSMVGTLNVQFASNAELDPMDYTFTAQSLAKPTYTLNEGKLTVNAVENATSYKLSASANGVTINQNVNAGAVIDLANALKTAGATSGTYTFTLTASATGYTSSSEEISYAYTATP